MDPEEGQAGAAAAASSVAAQGDDSLFYPSKEEYERILGESKPAEKWIRCSIRSEVRDSAPDIDLTEEGFKGFVAKVSEYTANDVDFCLNKHPFGSRIYGPGTFQTRGVKPVDVYSLDIHHFVFYQLKFGMEYPSYVQSLLSSLTEHAETLAEFKAKRYFLDQVKPHLGERIEFISNPLYFLDQKRGEDALKLLPRRCLHYYR